MTRAADRLVADLDVCLQTPGTPAERIARAYLADHPRLSSVLKAQRIYRRSDALRARGYTDAEANNILAEELFTSVANVRRLKRKQAAETVTCAAPAAHPD